MDFTKRLLTQWALEEGLTPLGILRDSFEGETERTWWFSCKGTLLSPKSGLCDKEAICFFSGTHHLTESEQTLIDQELLSLEQYENLTKPHIQQLISKAHFGGF